MKRAELLFAAATMLVPATLGLGTLGCDSPTATTTGSRPVFDGQDHAAISSPRSDEHGDAVHPVLDVRVMDITTGRPIARGQTVAAGDAFQVSVSTAGADCAGMFVVTALGAPGAPPSVLVQLIPYIVGPSVGSDTATGGTLTAGVRPNGTNDWKISASCNGADPDQFGFSRFEFFSAFAPTVSPGSHP